MDRYQAISSTLASCFFLEGEGRATIEVRQSPWIEACSLSGLFLECWRGIMTSYIEVAMSLISFDSLCIATDRRTRWVKRLAAFWGRAFSHGPYFHVPDCFLFSTLFATDRTAGHLWIKRLTQFSLHFKFLEGRRGASKCSSFMDNDDEADVGSNTRGGAAGN